VIKAGVFTITPAVTASVRFDPDYRQPGDRRCGSPTSTASSR